MMNPSSTPLSIPPHAPSRRTNRNALASLILGLGSWVAYIGVFCFNLTFGTLLALATYGVGTLCMLPLGCISPIMWLAAVITGHIGLKRAREEEGNGRVMAIVGMVAGYIGLGLMLALVLVILVVALITGGFTFMDPIYQQYFNGEY